MIRTLPSLAEIRLWKARKSLAYFTTYTKPDYLMGWVHREICSELDDFLQAVADKKSPRLIITMPPRSGKSELVSRRFPAYALGRNPDLSIIATSYSADLSQRFNRDVQRVIDDEPYYALFPNTKLNGSRVKTDSRGAYIRTSDLFEVVGHVGSYRSCGVGGGITGQGADILIIDDPIKDRADANSSTIRQSIWDWYTSTAYTRLSPGGGVIVMATRWHVDDLIGRLINAMNADSEADQFKIVNYPAIAEHDELHRKTGEALHPERYNLKQLTQIKNTVGSRDWNALYQQRPIIEGGGLIRTEWFKRYRIPPKLSYRIIASDTALKTREYNDYSVFGIAGLGEDGNLYILDILRGKWESPDLLKRASDFWNKHVTLDSSKIRGFYIEDKASGTGLVQTLQRSRDPVIPVLPVERTIDKLTRYQDVLPFIESGRVYIPESAPWVNDFLRECEEIQPDMKHRHDDQIDVLADLINLTLQKNSNFSWQRIFN